MSAAAVTPCARTRGRGPPNLLTPSNIRHATSLCRCQVVAALYLCASSATLSKKSLLCAALGRHPPLPTSIPACSVLILAAHAGFLSTIMTESPLKNILLMKRSLLMGLPLCLPFPVLGASVHISFTFSRTMLQCLSKAFTLASSFLLFLQLIKTWQFFLTESESTLRGPTLKSSLGGSSPCAAMTA
eukprot:CAMPEP_0184312064 /NCGR_PEP_ID=MMETSP1049-20130417/46629_1 /TAXON_ID=77928 /ORGANISM="Proteomonas sulcata, Strain CCMP704" /LENGTH=186 /DNA_ID=CAMNT_0026627923 /DNA_START=89 /DNA_END=646 /DNA_ORIENTATION=-